MVAATQMSNQASPCSIRQSDFDLSSSLGISSFGIFHVLCLSLLLAPLAGCGRGDGRATVVGEVSLDGAPLATGLIEFTPAPGTTGVAAGGVIENGSYAIPDKGPLPGSYQVRITAIRATGRQVPMPTIGPGARPGAMMEEKVQYIPARYNTETELVVEIEAGKNRHNFELEGGDE